MNAYRLNKEEIKKIIPHRDPMLLIDEVTELVPGEKIIAGFHVDPSREIFKGHFPDDPVLPGVYTVEIMAQASDIMLLSLERYAGKIPYFIGIDNVRFKLKILPGDRLVISSELASEDADRAIVKCRASVYKDGVPACTGDITLAMR